MRINDYEFAKKFNKLLDKFRTGDTFILTREAWRLVNHKDYLVIDYRPTVFCSIKNDSIKTWYYIMPLSKICDLQFFVRLIECHRFCLQNTSLLLEPDNWEPCV